MKEQNHSTQIGGLEVSPISGTDTLTQRQCALVSSLVEESDGLLQELLVFFARHIGFGMGLSLRETTVRRGAMSSARRPAAQADMDGTDPGGEKMGVQHGRNLFASFRPAAQRDT